MKKIVAILLMLTMLVPAALLTACADPLQDKIDEMGDIYAKLPDSLYLATEAAYFSNAVEDASVKAKINSWKKQIKAAKNVYSAFEQYDEDELQGFIDQWTALKAEMDALYEQYKEPLLAAKEQAKQLMK